jgi:hypothetical protein
MEHTKKYSYVNPDEICQNVMKIKYFSLYNNIVWAI